MKCLAAKVLFYRAFFICAVGLQASNAVIGSASENEEVVHTDTDTEKAFPLADFDFAEMTRFVQSTDEFLEKPCVIFREIWDPEFVERHQEWDDVFYQARVNPDDEQVQEALDELSVVRQAPDELRGVTLHHSLGYQGESPINIKRTHVNERGYKDIGYHFMVMAEPQLPRSRSSSAEDKAVLTAELEVYRHWISQATDDERNIGCVWTRGWMIFEGRPLRYMGAHVGVLDVTWDKELNLYRVGGQRGITKIPLEIHSSNSYSGIMPMYLEFVPEKMAFVVVDENKDAIEHEGRRHYLPLNEHSPVVERNEEGSLQLKVIENQSVRLSLNTSRIGVMLSGTYHPRGPATPFGYAASARESERQAPREAVQELGRLLNRLKQDYPLKEISAHSGGHICQRDSFTGGSCPGPGCMPLLEALSERFFPQGPEQSASSEKEEL